MKPVLILAILVSTACSTDELESPGPGDNLMVAFGERVLIPEESLIITFTELNEDSRCPSDVICVTQGQATITVAISRGSSHAEPRTLRIPGVAASYLHYSIALVELSPYPTTSHQPTPDEYVATLVVTK